jgi:hypothetical protein
MGADGSFLGSDRSERTESDSHHASAISLATEARAGAPVPPIRAQKYTPNTPCRTKRSLRRCSGVHRVQWCALHRGRLIPGDDDGRGLSTGCGSDDVSGVHPGQPPSHGRPHSVRPDASGSCCAVSRDGVVSVLVGRAVRVMLAAGMSERRGMQRRHGEKGGAMTQEDREILSEILALAKSLRSGMAKLRADVAAVRTPAAPCRPDAGPPGRPGSPGKDGASWCWECRADSAGPPRP